MTAVTFQEERLEYGFRAIDIPKESRPNSSSKIRQRDERLASTQFLPFSLMNLLGQEQGGTFLRNGIALAIFASFEACFLVWWLTLLEDARNLFRTWKAF